MDLARVAGSPRAPPRPATRPSARARRRRPARRPRRGHPTPTGRLPGPGVARASGRLHQADRHACGRKGRLDSGDRMDVAVEDRSREHCVRPALDDRSGHVLRRPRASRRDDRHIDPRLTARSRARSNPERVPSRSMEVSRISPAPSSTTRSAQATASRPVGSRPPRTTTSQRRVADRRGARLGAGPRPAATDRPRVDRGDDALAAEACGHSGG